MELGTLVALTGGLARIGNALGVPPSAAGQLPDLALAQGTAMTPADLSADFTGPSLVFALAPESDPLPEGLVLSASGMLSGTPSVATVFPLNLVVRATNAEGSADSSFQASVEAMILNFSATLTGLADNPVHGPSAETGAAVTAVAAGFSGAPPAGVFYQWKTIESGAIAGATTDTLVPDASAYDGEALYCTISAPPYPDRDTATAVIRRVPPVVQGGLVDEILDLGSGPYTLDAGAVFVGQGLLYTVQGPGCTIDPQSGLLTVSTDAPVAGAIVTVAAMNSGGQATADFQLTVEDLEGGPGPELSVPVLDEANDSISFVVTEDCTIYWRRDPLGTNPDAAQVIGGGGFDSGSFAVFMGSNNVDIAFAQGNDGLQALSLVAAVVPSEPSLVRTVTLNIDTEAPMLLSSDPPADATAVAPDVLPTLVFDEPIVAGQGGVTLWDVTAGASAEAFDVVADAGAGPGQVSIAADQLSLRPSLPLAAGGTYAILLDPGAIRDEAGNAHPGISDPAALRFGVASAAIIATDFGPEFVAAYPGIWASMQANPFNAVALHRPTEAWTGYAQTTTPGGVVGDKTGAFAQLRFAVPVTAGRSYEIDADLPLGESHNGQGFSGVLRIKIGSAINASDYYLSDVAAAGQPKVEALRGVTFLSTTTSVWFAFISETNQSGSGGGDPAISMLNIREV